MDVVIDMYVSFFDIFLEVFFFTVPKFRIVPEAMKESSKI